ncbi:MAG: sugar ABC transporter permease, partial [Eubacterium sp.]|nr:sugar ABC transporter permease [Eubacterium sp.]
MKQNTVSYKVKQYLMFAGPGTILFFAVVIIPFIYGLYLTLTSWDGVSLTKPFVGFENFANAFKDTAYWAAMGRTVIYSAIAVVLINVVSFALAYLVTKGIKGQNFFR